MITRRARLGVAVFWLLVLLAAASLILASLAVSTGYTASKCHTVSQCRHDLAWHRKHEADLLRQMRAHWEPTRERLICPIAAALGVSCSEARAVNRCESNTDRMVANSSAHVGWFQESSSFMTDNGLPWANEQRWEPVINVLAALLVVKREGWGQWTCRP